MTPERFRKLKGVLDRRQPDLTVLTENVHKPHNLSAILRSCDAAGVFEAHAVAGGETLTAHHMSAAGSTKWVPFRSHSDLASAVAALRGSGHRLVAAHFSDEAVDFRGIDYTQPTAVVLGSELVGVSVEAAAAVDSHLVIPMHGMVASLNVSVAAALILYEAERQRETAGLYSAGARLEPGLYRRRLFEWAYPEIAETCRQRGEPYPELDEDGYLLSAKPSG